MDNNNNLSYEDLTSETQKKTSKGFAIASLVLGIVSIVCCCGASCGLPFVCGILAIVFFFVDKKKNDVSSGLALAGLICGIIGIVMAISTFLIPTDAFESNELYQEYLQIYESALNQQSL